MNDKTERENNSKWNASIRYRVKESHHKRVSTLHGNIMNKEMGNECVEELIVK